jgi:hypothetical protein
MKAPNRRDTIASDLGARRDPRPSDNRRHPLAEASAIIYAMDAKDTKGNILEQLCFIYFNGKPCYPSCLRALGQSHARLGQERNAEAHHLCIVPPRSRMFRRLAADMDEACLNDP